MKMKSTIVAAAMGLALGSSAFAQLVFSVDFENPIGAGSGSPGFEHMIINAPGLVGGFTVGGSVDLHGVGVLNDGPNASQTLDLVGGDSNLAGSITRTFATNIGSTYELKFDYFRWGDDDTPGMDMTFGTLASEFFGKPASPVIDLTRSFVATGASATLSFVGRDPVGSNPIYGGVTLDNIRVTEFANVGVIPEPEAYAMALLGLGVLGAMSRRRRQQS